MNSISVRDEETGLNIHFSEGIKVYEIKSNKDYDKLPAYNNLEDHPDYMCCDITLSKTMKLFPDLWKFPRVLSEPDLKIQIKKYTETLKQAYKNAR